MVDGQVIGMSFSEVALFVGLGAGGGLRRRIVRDRRRADRDPIANRRLRFYPTRLAGNVDGDGSCQRECDLVDLRTKEALACSRWPDHDGLQHGAGARVLPNGAVR